MTNNRTAARWIPVNLASVTGIGGTAAVTSVTGHTMVPCWIVGGCFGLLAGWGRLIQLVDERKCRAENRRVGGVLADGVVQASTPAGKRRALETYLRFRDRDHLPPELPSTPPP